MDHVSLRRVIRVLIAIRPALAVNASLSFNIVVQKLFICGMNTFIIISLSIFFISRQRDPGSLILASDEC